MRLLPSGCRISARPSMMSCASMYRRRLLLLMIVLAKVALIGLASSS